MKRATVIASSIALATVVLSNAGAQSPSGGNVPNGSGSADAGPAIKEKGGGGGGGEADKGSGDGSTKGGGGGGDSLSDVKGGKLIRYGITAGAAGVVSRGIDDAQQAFITGTMPYIAVFPSWWWIEGSSSRAYCAAKFQGDDDPSGAANKLAVSRTLDILYDLRTGATGDRKDQLDKDIAAVSDLEKALPLHHGDDRLNPQTSSAAKAVLTYDKWDLRLAGSCPPVRWFGGYFGIPSKFSANGQPTTTDKVGAHDFQPLASFGLAFAPTASVAILVGATYSHVTSEDNSVHGAWALTLGLGGNLDVIGYLAGK